MISQKDSKMVNLSCGASHVGCLYEPVELWAQPYQKEEIWMVAII